MELMFLGATSTVTGSKYLLRTNSQQILIDCGLFQGYKELRLRNWAELPVDPQSLDAVVLTHAHIDHSGYLPLLVKNGYTGKIYCTRGTADLCSILLPDSGHIQEEDARRANKHGYSKHKPALPLYTRDEALSTQKHFVPLEFNKKYSILNGVSVEFFPAGHIIGASILRFQAEEKTIVFTGDLGRPHDPLMKPPCFLTFADYIVAEATYGDRLHDTEDPVPFLAEAIKKTAARGGSILLPSFAIGRVQIILYYVYLMKKRGLIPDLPVFLDSPLAQNASALMVRYADEHRLNEKLCKDICAMAQYVNSPEESKAIDQLQVPIIIISASGMMEGGRVLHHLRTFLPNHRNTVMLTGYQAGGTRGDRLLHKEPFIKIHGEMVPVRAEVLMMNSLSAHADYQEMLAWLGHFKQAPRKVYLTHGELSAAKSLKEKIEKEFGWVCTIPTYLQTDQL